MTTLTRLEGPRPVLALTARGVCLVDGLPWPPHAPPFDRALRRWPAHLRGSTAAAVARIGAGVRPVTTAVDLAQLGGAAPDAPGWWIAIFAGEASALWVDVVIDEGVRTLGWWWACQPGRLLDGGHWPETVWDHRALAVPLARLRAALGVRAHGLTGVRAVLARLAAEEPQVVLGEQHRPVEQVVVERVDEAVGVDV